MSEQNFTRTFLAGKIISNFGQSSIGCVVRRISDEGATIEVESVFGIPEHFHLQISHEGPPRPCRRKWQSGKEIGLEFETADDVRKEASVELPSSEQIMRVSMLALRAALDEIEVGVVLLDSNMRSQFINRAFRRMWALPDSVADRNPAFVALMYHGRDTKAYLTAANEIDAYVAERVRLVIAGDTTPINLRRSNGKTFQMQCAVLPNGGRMLSYTDVTEIIRHSDELEVLRSALDNLQDGVVLLDADMNAQFLNRKMRAFWKVSDEKARSRPSYASLIASGRHAVSPGLAPDQVEAFFEQRVAEVRAGEQTPRDLLTPDGLNIRARCTVLGNGGRMLTYSDISDLVRHAEQLERLATIDSMTGLSNRRHFLALAQAEWDRFQRYHRPISMLMIDIDHFKSVNDRYGHAVGDEAIVSVAAACMEGKRGSDIVGRLGGEEFAVLLPETNADQAIIVADRICKKIAARTLMAHRVHFKVTASVGLAQASISMSGIDVLMQAADQALYQAKADGRNRIVRWSPPEIAKRAAE